MTPPPPSAAFITVVSGLPRSGTSMMMRALDAGGIPALSDNSRAADIDNPFGYFEYEPVKALRRQAGWLEAARGHCVKIIYRLLYDLPDTLPYRIVFMERNLDEVIASQNAMLRRLGRPVNGGRDADLKGLFERELSACDAWLRTQPNVCVLRTSYQAAMSAPGEQFAAVALFLDRRCDIEAMVATVDPSLHRERRN